ncbi:hypothetical protein OCGS_0380 [Oceaniovalibus guishaninsula JLT2003]|uniref:Acyltransferase 3 domain-containing protein n=1 Tax=Oceaniovalibus guishaninsula JLT2003 TaxID=1231392 RepID=K2I8B6_9RHOB|nr:acyltransferase [Oceaniovalibus guishaninsula]EKE45290.1 hypothetical protein OCGS_0380 [Oceaniovalibus guishaninsula JLT2003]
MPELDGLRAIAVLAVLAAHFRGGPVVQAVLDRAPFGHMGVQLFFVLSGFLITSILIDCRRHAETDGWRGVLPAFYIRRFLRIFPLYYFVVLAIAVFDGAGAGGVLGYHAVFLSNLPGAIWAGDLATGPLLYPPAGHFWSLAVEEQFYLLWPLAVLFVPIRLLVPLTLALIAVAPVCRAAVFAVGFQQQPGYLLSHTDALAAGAFLSMTRCGWTNIPPMTRHLRRTVPAIALIVAGAALVLHNMQILYRPFWVVFPTAEAICYAALIALLLDGRLAPLATALRRPALVFIGRISFGIYLLHPFVLMAFRRTVADLTDTAHTFQTVVVIAATILVAALSFRCYEAPIGRLKRFFPYTRPTWGTVPPMAAPPR